MILPARHPGLEPIRRALARPHARVLAELVESLRAGAVLTQAQRDLVAEDLRSRPAVARALRRIEGERLARFLLGEGRARREVVLQVRRRFHLGRTQAYAWLRPLLPP